MTASSVVVRLCGAAICWAAIFSAAAPLRAAEADFYVAPNGNDQWSGKSADANPEKSDGPFATLGTLNKRCGS